MMSSSFVFYCTSTMVVFYDLFIVLTSVVTAAAAGFEAMNPVETTVDSPGSVLFLKQDVSPNQRPPNVLDPLFVTTLQAAVTAATPAAAGSQQHRQQVAFVPLLRPSALVRFRSSFGDLDSAKSIPRSLVRSALGSSDRHHPSTVVQGSTSSASGSGTSTMDSSVEISAHLVTQAIFSDRPFIQVLFHAGHHALSLVGSATPQQPSSSSSTTVDAARYCAVAHAVYRGSSVPGTLSSQQPAPAQLISSGPCSLTSRTVACLASIVVPPSWWLLRSDVGDERSDIVHVYFTAGRQVVSASASGNVTVSCSTTMNGSVARNTSFGNGMADKGGRTWDESIAAERSYVGTLTMAQGQVLYDELKEDRNVLIYVPQGSFYPGSRFRVPVKLQVESTLHLFVVKVRARHGVKIVGAEAKNTSTWRIGLDLSHKLHGAVVTAIKHSTDSSLSSDKIEDVFEWIFEVDEEAIGDDRGRIQIVVEYELKNTGLLSSSSVSAGQASSAYQSVENRITAHVDIQRDNTYAIVPVVKVVESCNWVYMDGTETHGSSSVTVITKYGRHTRFTLFEVWAPQIPVQVVLSDNTLSQIKGWKVPGRQNPIRKTRGAEFGLLSHPGLLLQEDAISSGSVGASGQQQRKDDVIGCEPRYQSSVVNVFASFSVADVPNGQRHLVGRDAMFDITDLVRSELRVADPSVATLNDNGGLASQGQGHGDSLSSSFVVVEGHNPGRTEVQVLSRSGRVIGSAELSVNTDRVGIEQLEVGVVSSLMISSLGVATVAGSGQSTPSEVLSRVLVAEVTRTSQLTRKYQEALLSVAIRFDDGVVAPLRYFPPADYSLDVQSHNVHVIAIGDSPSPDTPRVTAVGPGKGQLVKVSLEPPEQCQRKKSPRALVAADVTLDIDFSRPGDLQSDAAPAVLSIFPDTSAPRAVPAAIGTNLPRTGNEALSKSIDRKPALHLSLDDHRRKKTNGPSAAAAGDENASGALQYERSDVHVRHAGSASSGSGQPMSALEVSMYTLLGVFCVAVVIFSVNCAVFVGRYRRRRKGVHGSGLAGLSGDTDIDKEDPENCSPDWVWIGRETLERNAINTGCSEALMPDADFNGNHAASTASGSASAPIIDGSSSSTTSGFGNSVNGGQGINAGGGTGSNRNSYISTYKGAECSVQIGTSISPATAPMPDLNANLISGRLDGGARQPAANRVNRGVQTLPRSATNKAPSSAMTSRQAVLAGAPTAGGSLTRPRRVSRLPLPSETQVSTESSLDDDDEEDYDMSSLESPRRHGRQLQYHHDRHRQVAGGHRGGQGHAVARSGRSVGGSAEKMTRAQRLRRLEEAVASGSSDIEWDCNELGVTYDQLMTYFDNLKESTA